MASLRRFLILFLGVFMIFHSAWAKTDTLSLLVSGGDGGWLNVARPLTREDMRGRLILLDFWTYGCINCMHVVPDLVFLEEKFGNRLLVIGVHSAKFKAEQGSERILAAAKRFGLNHPVINDSSFSIWNSFNVRAWPTMVLLNGDDGMEISRYSGEGHREELAADIEKSSSSAGPPASAPDFMNNKAEDTAILSFPARLAYADKTPWGPLFFVADSGHNRILGFDGQGNIKITIGSGAAGKDDGAFEAASFNHPRGVTVAGDRLYVADTENHMLRLADFTAKTVKTVAGTGEQGYDRDVQDKSARSVALSSPWDVEEIGNTKLAIAMAGTHQLWVYDTEKDTISVLAGSGIEDIQDRNALHAALAQPSGLSRNGGVLYFVDAESSALRQMADGKVKTLVGTGLFDFGLADGRYPWAKLQHPQGLYADQDRIIVADTYNNALRLYDRNTGELSTLRLPADALSEPGDVLVVGGKAYVADTNHHDIKWVDLNSGVIDSLALRKETSHVK